MTSFIKMTSILVVSLSQILVTRPFGVPHSPAWCLQKSSAILPLEDRFFSKLNERRKKSERKALNKSTHSAEGNKSKTFRVDSWNCGNGSVLNKVNEIKHLIQQRRPHVLIIQEANIFSWEPAESLKINEYKMYKLAMIENPSRNCTRIIIYVKNNIK